MSEISLLRRLMTSSFRPGLRFQGVFRISLIFLRGNFRAKLSAIREFLLGSCSQRASRAADFPAFKQGSGIIPFKGNFPFWHVFLRKT